MQDKVQWRTGIDAKFFEIVDLVYYMFKLTAVIWIVVIMREIPDMDLIDYQFFIRWQRTVIVFPFVFI